MEALLSYRKAWLALGLSWTEFNKTAPFIVVQTVKAQNERRNDELTRAAFIGEVFARTKKLSQDDLNKFLTNPPKRDEHIESLRILRGLGISEDEILEAREEARKAKEASNV